MDRRTRRREGRTDAKGEGEPRVHATEFLLPREGVVGRRATSICLVRLPHQERPRIPRASITSSSYQPRRRTAPVCSTLYAAHPPTYTFLFIPLVPSPTTFRPLRPFPPSRSSLVLSLATHLALAIVSEEYTSRSWRKPSALANPVNPEEGRDHSTLSTNSK